MAPRAPKVELFRGDAVAASPKTPSLNYRQRTNKGKGVGFFKLRGGPLFAHSSFFQVNQHTHTICAIGITL